MVCPTLEREPKHQVSTAGKAQKLRTARKTGRENPKNINCQPELATAGGSIEESGVKSIRSPTLLAVWMVGTKDE